MQPTFLIISRDQIMPRMPGSRKLISLNFLICLMQVITKYFPYNMLELTYKNPRCEEESAQRMLQTMKKDLMLKEHQLEGKLKENHIKFSAKLDFTLFSLGLTYTLFIMAKRGLENSFGPENDHAIFYIRKTSHQVFVTSPLFTLSIFIVILR